MSDDNVIDLNAKRKLKQRETQSEKEQEQEDLLQAAAEWLDEKQLREVLRLGCYFAKTESGHWIPIKKDHFSCHYPEWSAKFAKAVTHVMYERGWNYHDVTYTFREPPADVLNLMDTGNWLKPEKGRYHWIFDVLTFSIGGGTDENIDHIRHCIAYKYLHPEAYTIPNLVIHGEGSIGKGLMIDFVLKAVFGGGTLTDMAENICSGGFNSPIKAKVVVCVDESMKDRTDASKMKRFAGNPFITINEKNIPAFQADNLIWYWIVSNEKETAGIWLDRSHADRRYSVLHVEQGFTLEYWIALAKGWLDGDPSCEQYVTQTKRAKQWMFTEGIKHLTDPEEISHWLHSLIEEYGEREHPVALHGADYHRLMGVQQRVDERIIEAVFTDPEFTHIRKTALYEGYKICAATSGQRGAVLDSVFYQKVTDWLKQRPELKIAEKRQVQKTGFKERKFTIWYDTTKPDHIRGVDNTDHYLHFKDWIGPEI